MKVAILVLSWATILTFFVLAILSGNLNLPFLSDSKGFSSKDYEAVFLTNGQVYFGKVSDLSRRYVKLSDIYYLIQQQPLQNQEEPSPTPAQPEFTLIKLGGELHGPVDNMIINRDQILFIEQLKKDSRVVQAIENSKKGK